MILTEKLYLTADKTQAVKRGDPRAAFLLGAPGTKIKDELAKKLGLLADAEAVIASVVVGESEVQTREPEITNRDPVIQQPRRRGRPPRQAQ